MFVLKGIFGGSLKITSENKNNLEAKNSLKRFLGIVSEIAPRNLQPKFCNNWVWRPNPCNPSNPSRFSLPGGASDPSIPSNNLVAPQ